MGARPSEPGHWASSIGQRGPSRGDVATGDRQKGVCFQGGGQEALTLSRVDRCRGRRWADISLTHTHCRNKSHVTQLLVGV